MACLTGDRERDLGLLRLLKRRLTGNFIAAYNYLKASHKEEEGQMIQQRSMATNRGLNGSC